MRERNARLGHTDKFHRLLRRDGQRQCIRIGEADVFASKNDDASRDETEIFAGMEHFSEPVHRAFFIGRTHAFDKRADGIVVRVALAIIDDGLLLDAFLGDCEREVNCAARVRRRCQHANFERI